MRLLPIDICSYIGGVLGRIVGPLHKQADKQLRNNLQQLRPDIGSSQRLQTMVMRSWENYGRVMAEISVLQRILRSSDRTTIIGSEHFTAAKTLDRPLIAMFMHLGNWEIIGPKLYDLIPTPTIQIYQILDHPVQARIAAKVRQPYMESLLTAGPHIAKQIYNKLMGGWNLNLAVDECVNNEVCAPSFGRPLNRKNNLTKAVRFAKLTNAILCPVYALRQNGARFVIHILEPVVFDFEAITVNEAVMHLDTILDPIIRQYIDQWYYGISLNLKYAHNSEQ